MHIKVFREYEAILITHKRDKTETYVYVKMDKQGSCDCVKYALNYMTPTKEARFMQQYSIFSELQLRENTSMKFSGRIMHTSIHTEGELYRSPSGFASIGGIRVDSSLLQKGDERGREREMDRVQQYVFIPTVTASLFIPCSMERK